MSGAAGRPDATSDALDPDAPDDVEIEIVSIGDEGIDAMGPDSTGSDPAELAGAGDPPAPGSDGGPAMAELERRLAVAQEEKLRLRAEFENFKKRLEREREERERRALAATFLDLLPVVDNLERAAVAKGAADDLRRGVELVARQLVDVLRRFGLQEIPAAGQPFDPRWHEAVAREESDAHAVPTVVAELQRGYFLNERLLRPAMVRVAMPVEREPSAESAAADPSNPVVTVAAGGPDGGPDAGEGGPDGGAPA